MNLNALGRRFFSLPNNERGYFLKRFIDLTLHQRSGFSQYGEDASAASYFRAIGRSCRSYVDIGANHPIIHSNTYLFYRDGARGVLAEANPQIVNRIRRKRPRDLVLNIAVVPEGSGMIDLHVMDMDGLSTVSSSWLGTVKAEGIAREKNIVSVQAISINDFLNNYCMSDRIDFASLDVEGIDVEVLEAWDFDRWRPHLLCVETATIGSKEYTRDERSMKILANRNYQPIFETFGNSIFVDCQN